MHPRKRTMLWIHLLGGAAVLGSYTHGLATHPEGGEALWGGVQPQLRPLCTAGMVLAALGYLGFTYFLLMHLDPAEARVGPDSDSRCSAGSMSGSSSRLRCGCRSRGG